MLASYLSPAKCTFKYQLYQAVLFLVAQVVPSRIHVFNFSLFFLAGKVYAKWMKIQLCILNYYKDIKTHTQTQSTFSFGTKVREKWVLHFMTLVL